MAEVIAGNFPQHGAVLLAARADEGCEWLYWTGVNWLGTKARAVPVLLKNVQATVANCHWRHIKQERV